MEPKTLLIGGSNRNNGDDGISPAVQEMYSPMHINGEVLYYESMINGQLEGFFAAARDLRQGDPISPDLFLLVMEEFKAIQNHNI